MGGWHLAKKKAKLSRKNNINVAVKLLDIPYIYFQYSLLPSKYTVSY